MLVFYGKDDLVGVNFFFGEGFQDTCYKNLLINSTHNRVVRSHTTINCHIYFHKYRALLGIITGDLNIYHILTQLDRCFNSNEQHLSNPYYNEAHSTSFIVAYSVGFITRWLNSSFKQDLCIDLIFYNEEISNHI